MHSPATTNNGKQVAQTALSSHSSESWIKTPAGSVSSEDHSGSQRTLSPLHSHGRIDGLAVLGLFGKDRAHSWGTV